MLITRRSLILAAPAALITVPARASFLLALGELIVDLFVELVKVGIEWLITSAGKYILSHYFNTGGGRPGYYVQTAQPYLEQGHAADNFCPYCTVEYAQKGKKFWDGKLFQPNEENEFYRGYNKPTDQVLLDLTKDSDSLWYLDMGRNQNAHLPTSVIDEIRTRVSSLETDKSKLYYGIEKHTLTPGQLDEYLIPRAALREIDQAYLHVKSRYHINPKYEAYVLQLQRFATWFNAKLLSIQTVTSRGELIA